MKGKIISIVNQKGGVGKTTTVANLGAGLTQQGYKVLFLDLDAQCNLTDIYQMNAKYSILDVLSDKINIEKAIVSIEQGDFISGDELMFDYKIIDNLFLNEKLEKIKNSYDFIIIDTAPALNSLTINALCSSDYVIIPSQVDIFSLKGLNLVMNNITTLKKEYNKKLRILGVLLVRYQGRNVFTKQLTEFLKNNEDIKIFESKIRECIAIKEAQGMQKDIFTYNKKSNASIDYNNFIDEILKEVK